MKREADEAEANAMAAQSFVGTLESQLAAAERMAAEPAKTFVKSWQEAAPAASKEMKKAQADLAASAKQVIEQTRTPAERFKEETARLSQMLSAGLIDKDTYNRAVTAAKTEAANASAERPAVDLGGPAVASVSGPSLPGVQGPSLSPEGNFHPLTQAQKRQRARQRDFAEKYAPPTAGRRRNLLQRNDPTRRAEEARADFMAQYGPARGRGGVTAPAPVSAAPATTPAQRERKAEAVAAVNAPQKGSDKYYLNEIMLNTAALRGNAVAIVPANLRG
jgi:hypothetical protein